VPVTSKMIRANVVAVACLLALAVSPALARPAPTALAAHGTAIPQGALIEASNCAIHTLPGLMRQGELGQVGSVGDVVQVECNPRVLPGGTPVEISDAQLLSRCSLSGGTVTWVDPNEFGTGTLKLEKGAGITVEIDGDGNATVALVAGPNCAVGGTVISAHTMVGGGNTTVESFSAAFAVMEASTTPEGVTVTPNEQVEDEGSGSVATLVQAEFASTEAKVRIAAPELGSRCQLAPHLAWLRANGELVTASELAGGTAIEPTGPEALRTDNDGNAFVIAIGDASCMPGKSYFEVDLEASPFTTEEPSFTILPPQSTPEPAFSIEKLQHIAGASGTFTRETLTGSVGETVEYEITVSNETNAPETFTDFLDANCAAGTISGGPTGPVEPRASTTYKCSHPLTEPGTVVNQAEVTGGTAGGTPLTKQSNVVQVNVTPAPRPGFSLEKQQRIGGTSYTAAPLTGAVGETVEYEIVAHNTGNTPLIFSEFDDPYCNEGTIAGGPGIAAVAEGGTTTWTCTRPLPNAGTFTNVATVVGTPPGGSPKMETTAPVEVVVPGPAAGQLTIEKLQRIAGSGASFASGPLSTTVGHTVEYEIVVKNIGTIAETIAELTDPFCESGTLSGGQGSLPLAPGASTTYTCARALGTAGAYVNVAAVLGGPAGGPPMEFPSAPVETRATSPSALPTPPQAVETPKRGVLASCTATAPVLHGAKGLERGRFRIAVPSGGVKQITFYLDGRKLKALSHSQARNGRFTVVINAARLRYGTHRISFTAVMENINCARSASSQMFVRPRAARAKVLFTG
jgi:hypothetical protein